MSSKRYRRGSRMALAADAERELLLRRLFENLPGINRLSDRALAVSGLTDLVEHLSWVLYRHDHISMAASIEMRVLFLEKRLIDFGMHLPRAAELRRGQGKWVLKPVALTRLPRDVVYARKKGFPMPSAYTDGTERILLGGLLADQSQWSSATIKLIVDDLRHDVEFRFLMVGTELWLRQQFGGETSDAIGEKLLAHAPCLFRLTHSGRRWTGRVRGHENTLSPPFRPSPWRIRPSICRIRPCLSPMPYFRDGPVA